MSHPDAFQNDGPPILQLQVAVKALDGYVRRILPPPPPPSPSPSSSSSSSPTGVLLEPTGKEATAQPPHRTFSQPSSQAHWRALREAHVAVCGLGGVGAVAAEALVRGGIGRVLLVDHERITLSALGQPIYLPSDVGCSRTQALRLRLQGLSIGRAQQATATSNIAGLDDQEQEHNRGNPCRPAATPVAIVDSFRADFTKLSDMIELRKQLKVNTTSSNANSSSSSSFNSSNNNGHQPTTSTGRGSSPPVVGLFEALTQQRPFDALLSCAEDAAARLALNQLCLELRLPMLQVTQSPCNTRIQVRSVLPGHTCCLECIQSATTDGTSMDAVAQSIAQAFPSSLPHADLVAGGTLAQHTVKFLLELGDFVPFYTLNLLSFEVESYAFPPNPMCPNMTCRQRQDEQQQQQQLQRQQQQPQYKRSVAEHSPTSPTGMQHPTSEQRNQAIGREVKSPIPQEQSQREV